MKYSATLYAKAFADVLREDNDEIKVTKNFVMLLQKNGDIGRSEEIVREIEKELIHRSGGHWVRIETARPFSGTMRKKIHSFFRKEDYIEEVLCPELLAGARLVVDNEQELDGSLKRKLEMLRK